MVKKMTWIFNINKKFIDFCVWMIMRWNENSG